MPYFKKITIFIVCTLLFAFIIHDPQKPHTLVIEKDLSHVNSIERINDYLPSAPIFIDSDVDFGPTNYNFDGSGTVEDPYKIENLNITDSTAHLIHIQDTSAHFNISHCWLNGINQNYYGIYLHNVLNGHIEFNDIKECDDGIHVEVNSENNIIMNNTLVYIKSNAIVLSYSCCNPIHNNTIHNSYNGISILSTKSCPIHDNTIYNIDNNGIHYE